MSSAFRAWFLKKFNAEFPMTVLPDLIAQPGDVYATENLAESLSSPPMMPEFRAEPREYVITGHWGRSVNTYAFYFVEVRPRHRRFFRLFCGGAYGDWARDATAVVSYLARYEAWRKTYEDVLGESTLIHNMGNDRAELLFECGERALIENHDTTLDWWKRLGDEIDRRRGRT